MRDVPENKDEDMGIGGFDDFSRREVTRPPLEDVRERLREDDDSDADEILAGMPDDALKGLMGSALGVVIGKDIKAENCPRIDSIVGALAPLPPSNVSNLLVQLIAMAGDKKDNPFKLCPTS